MVSPIKVKSLSGRAPGARTILALTCVLLSVSSEKAVIKLNTPDGMIGCLVCFSDNDGQTVLVADDKDTVEILPDSEGEWPRLMQQFVNPRNGILDHTEEVLLRDVPPAVVEKKLPPKEEKVG